MEVKQEYIDILLGIPEFSVAMIQKHWFEEDDEPQVWLVLRRKEARYRCPCGREFATYYDFDQRNIRDVRYGLVTQTVFFKTVWVMRSMTDPSAGLRINSRFGSFKDDAHVKSAFYPTG